jgi:hypothetical protein
VSAFQSPVLTPSARDDGVLHLLNAFKGTILAPKSPESDECRFTPMTLH